MLTLDDVEDMYHNHPFMVSIRSLRHRQYIRNIFYGFIFFSAVYILFHSVAGPDTDLSSSLPSSVYTSTPNVPQQVWDERAVKVKRAFLHAYHGYERYAAPKDELKPMSSASVNNFNGWGVSAYDGLDTMMIMGLDGEVERALKLIENTQFKLEEGKYAPYFETVIRYLGGLLSAYAISHNKLLLNRAEELAGKLDPIFKTPSGFPLYGVNPSDGDVVGPEIGILAEMASLQLEYTYLAKATGKKHWFDRVETIIQALSKANLQDTGGMFPVRWNLTSAQPYDSHLSVGAQADSAHEYLLKQYLLTGQSDKRNLEMYIRATTHIINNLIFISPTRHLMYVTDTSTSTFSHPGRPSHVFEHLSCFLPGLLALGAHTLPLDNLDAMGINLGDLASRGQFGNAEKGYRLLEQYNLKDVHMWVAEGLAQTCWLSYADEPSGLGPDEMLMKTEDSTPWGADADGDGKEGNGYLWIDALEKWKKSGSRGSPPGVGDKSPVIYTEKQRLTGKGKGRDYVIKKGGYILRPETLESLYLLWRITGNEKWRDRGWRIFDAIEKYTKTPYGYASLRSVEYLPPPKDDDMPSYVFAETFKYLYLMFINEDPIPLDKWVFNTEAHPLPVFKWTLREKELFNMI